MVSGMFESEGCCVEYYVLDFVEELSVYNGMLFVR